MKRIGIILPLIIALILSLLGCSRTAHPSSTTPNEQKLSIMVSILPQKTFVEKITGDTADVAVMLPPGANPETYAPTPRQLKDVTHAALYVMVGSPFPFEETWMDQIKGVNPQMKIVNSGEGIKIRGHDPHIWLSPILAKVQVENIYEGLIEIDPANKNLYKNNKDRFLKELDAVHQEIKTKLDRSPNKKFMVFHPSWGYFAADYGLEQVAIQVEGKEPSPVQIQKLIDEAKAEKIKVVFVQKQMSTKSAEMIADTIDGRVVAIDPLAPNYIENLKNVAKAFQQGMNVDE